VQDGDCAAHLGRFQRGERLLVQIEQQVQGAAIVLERRGRKAPLVLQRGEVILGVLRIHYSRQ